MLQNLLLRTRCSHLAQYLGKSGRICSAPNPSHPRRVPEGLPRPALVKERDSRLRARVLLQFNALFLPGRGLRNARHSSCLPCLRASLHWSSSPVLARKNRSVPWATTTKTEEEEPPLPIIDSTTTLPGLLGDRNIGRFRV